MTHQDQDPRAATSAAPAPISRPPRPRTVEIVVLALILAANFGLAFMSLRQKSVTADEFVHLPVGLSYLQTGEFRVESFNSPLIRVILALPNAFDATVALPLADGYQYRNHWSMGLEFMKANRERYQEIFVRSRIVSAVLGSGVIALLWWWTRRLFGPASALAAAGLAAFDPNLLAHERLVTADVGATLFFLAAAFFLHRFAERPSWGRAGGAGLMLGLAILGKFSALLLAILAPGALLVRQGWGADSKDRLLLWGRMALVFAVAWLVIGSFYGWRDFGRPLGHFIMRSDAGRRIAILSPSWLPVPAPAQLVEGMDSLLVANQINQVNYLFGELYRGGKPHYYLVALLAKTPLSTLALIALGAALSPKIFRGRRADLAFVVILPLILIAFITFSSGYNIGLRYILPAWPFLMMIGSLPLADCALPAGLPRRAATALVALTAGAAFLAFPDYLSYFNVAAGGERGGARVLADSNLDWGQDLIGLGRYLDEQGAGRVCLYYFGGADPAIYGIDYVAPDDLGSCSAVALSATYRAGLSYVMIDHGEGHEIAPRRFVDFQRKTPEAVIGGSIYLYKGPFESVPGP